MPDRPDRHVPPPPPTGGATPIPDVAPRSGQVPRRAAGSRAPLSRSQPPKPPAGHTPTHRAQDTPQPLAEATPKHHTVKTSVPVPPEAPSQADRTDSPDGLYTNGQADGPSRRARRQPLGSAPAERIHSNRPSARERLQRLVAQQGVNQGEPAGTPPAPSPAKRAGAPAAASHLEPPRAQSKVPPSRPTLSGLSRDRSVPARPSQAVPVIPEPPTRRSLSSGPSRVPEPPARSANPVQPRRPASRILEALDAKLAADQAVDAESKRARRQVDEAVRRVRPALSRTRPTPPKPPTPSVISAVPISPRGPQPGAIPRPGAPAQVSSARPATGVTPAADEVIPLPDPSVPPVPVIPLTLAEPATDRHEPPLRQHRSARASTPAHDPLDASYARLVKAAKRQAALEAAQAGQPPVEDLIAPEPPPAMGAGPGSVVDLEHLQAEFEQAKRDAERLFGPDDHFSTTTGVSAGGEGAAHAQGGSDAPEHVDRADLSIGPARPDDAESASNGPFAIPDPGEGVLGNEAGVLAKDAVSITAGIALGEGIMGIGDSPTNTGSQAIEGDPDIENGPGIGGSAEIEDAEIVAEPQPGATEDVIGTIIATDLDLVASPESVELVEPHAVTVDEDVLDGMEVEEAAIDDALATAPPRGADHNEEVKGPAPAQPVDDTPPQSRSFRALTAVLILIIFALVCIAAYRIMMRSGGKMAEPTPTPIVSSTQTAPPSESPGAARSPKASEPTPVPALPPREPLASDAAIPPALPGQSASPEVPGGAGNVEIGRHTISLSRINDVNLPGLVGNPVAGEDVQVQSILGNGAYVWMGSDQDNRILAVIPEPFQAALKDLQAGDRVDFIGTLAAADVPEILAPEQGRDRLIRQGAAIEVRDISVRH